MFCFIAIKDNDTVVFFLDILNKLSLLLQKSSNILVYISRSSLFELHA
jgi:hypothetical protein